MIRHVRFCDLEAKFSTPSISNAIPVNHFSFRMCVECVSNAHQVVHACCAQDGALMSDGKKGRALKLRSSEWTHRT
jgi:hypothetical protein